ncbi:MAG: AhpC/TSA family protein, partial [Polyangiaceae bacterium]
MTSEPKLDPALFDLVVLGENGEECSLGDLCASSPLTLLVFLRHFGCIGCSQQVDVLVPILDELHGLSVAVILVGNGDPHAIRGFIERERLRDYPVELVTDPTLRSHALAGFERSVWSTIGPAAIWADLVARSKGYTGSAHDGDAFQQGGVLLISESRRLVFRCASRVAYEPVSAAVILEAVLKNSSGVALATKNTAQSGV